MPAPSACQFNVFLDSDGPIADFDKALKKSGLTVEEFKHVDGTYLWLDVTPGARQAIQLLKVLDDENLLRVWVATKTPDNTPYAYTEKVLWYRRYFPWLENRVIVTHDKHQLGCNTDILVDDRPHKGNAALFRGTFLLYDVTKFSQYENYADEYCWVDMAAQILMTLFKKGLGYQDIQAALKHILADVDFSDCVLRKLDDMDDFQYKYFSKQLGIRDVQSWHE
jgi:5'(3')-deoxyribonucleotidase